jgi:hypothetical protein
MESEFQARQGDVFFEVAGKTPKFGDPKKRMKDNILAYGEVTGHSHAILSPSMDELDSFVDDNGDIFIRSHGKPIIVGHDEHNTITLPADTDICITRQRECNPVGLENDAVEEERRVRD